MSMKTKDDDTGVQGSDPSPGPWRLVTAPPRSTLSPRADLDPYLWLDTGGGCFEPQRGVLTKPRPTAWVRKCLPVGLAALKGRDRGYSPPRCHPFPCLAKAYFALSGLATRTRDVFRPRPLAWAVLGRPYRARWGVGNARTRGVQQKIWDTLSPWREGRGCFNEKCCPSPYHAAPSRWGCLRGPNDVFAAAKPNRASRGLGASSIRAPRRSAGVPYRP